MRIGLNPHKDQLQESPVYRHQVIVPVFIPNHEGYFKDSFRIFRLCISSLLATVHDKTFITIVNNGSDALIIDYLDELLQEKKIHELIHTVNIGKLNAIFKGLVGNNIELVTIADSDVLFLSNWQKETNKVYAAIPKAGVVGIVPQYYTHRTRCENIIWNRLFDKNLKFLPVKNPKALENFYRSVGWDSFVPIYHKVALGYEAPNGLQVYVGAGHFVATYKKDMFEEIVTYIGYKMGGLSEDFLDNAPLVKDYWRLTTYDNFAYHMGNTYEDWMNEVVYLNDETYQFSSNFPTYKPISKMEYFLKNKVIKRVFKSRKVKMLFYRFKKLPKEMIAKY